MAVVRERPNNHSLSLSILQYFDLFDSKSLSFWNMFAAHHAIKFAVLLIGCVGVIFQASSEEDSLANNPIPVNARKSEFDLNLY